MRAFGHIHSWRGVRPSRHPVVARAEGAADDDRELRHLRAGDCLASFAPSRHAAGLVLGADHEARDVLEEDEGHLALTGELDEVGALLGGLGEEDAVRCEDPDR